jgi:hypothetical protein
MCSSIFTPFSRLSPSVSQITDGTKPARSVYAVRKPTCLRDRPISTSSFCRLNLFEFDITTLKLNDCAQNYLHTHHTPPRVRPFLSLRRRPSICRLVQIVSSSLFFAFPSQTTNQNDTTTTTSKYIRNRLTTPPSLYSIIYQYSLGLQILARRVECMKQSDAPERFRTRIANAAPGTATDVVDAGKRREASASFAMSHDQRKMKSRHLI